MWLFCFLGYCCKHSRVFWEKLFAVFFRNYPNKRKYDYVVYENPFSNKVSQGVLDTHCAV